METIAIVPIAFGLYLILITGLSGLARWLAASGRGTSFKSNPYASGGAPPRRVAIPGYRPFFIGALFFAVLHLGVLMFATGYLQPVSGLYLLGLMLALAIVIGD
jgi:NADH:ubiquinone oxidoreductase subunit 3 (subunit A)